MLDNTIVSYEEVQKFLGIWFDRKMNFKHLVQTKAVSALRAFTAISRLASTERGLSLQALRQPFQSCVATVSDFGAEVWWKGQKG